MLFICFSFLNTPATTHISPLSLHDALPISAPAAAARPPAAAGATPALDLTALEQRLRDTHAIGLSISESLLEGGQVQRDRKSTRLNSSHMSISYAVFCLKKKKIQRLITYTL